MLTTALIASAVPAATSIAANFLSSPRQSQSERELRRLAEYFKKEADRPYMQTTEAQSNLQAINEADERNRKRSMNQGIRGGATGEQNIASTQANNEVYGSQVNRIAGRSDRYKGKMLSSYMGALQGADQMKAQSEQEWQGKVGQIVSGVGQAANMYAYSRLFGAGKGGDELEDLGDQGAIANPMPGQGGM